MPARISTKYWSAPVVALETTGPAVEIGSSGVSPAESRTDSRRTSSERDCCGVGRTEGRMSGSLRVSPATAVEKQYAAMMLQRKVYVTMVVVILSGWGCDQGLAGKTLPQQSREKKGFLIACRHHHRRFPLPASRADNRMVGAMACARKEAGVGKCDN